MSSSKADRRRQWAELETDTVVLHMFQRGLTKPNLSPFGFKFETFLRMADIKYVEDFAEPMSAKGKSPWMTFNGEDMADSQICIEHLMKELDKDLSKDLSDEQKAIERSFRIMLEDHLYFIIETLECTHSNGKYMKTIMPPMPLPFFVPQSFAFGQMIKTLKKQCHAQGIGRHSKKEVEKMGTAVLKSLSDYLGKKAYFFGKDPTLLDATVFGFMSMLLAGDPEDPILLKKRIAEDFANLQEHFDRVKDKYWSDWDEKLYVDLKAKAKEEAAAKKRAEAEERKKKKEEEAEKKKAEAEEKKKKKEEEEKKKKEEEEEKKKKEEETKKEEEDKGEEKKDEEKKE